MRCPESSAYEIYCQELLDFRATSWWVQDAGYSFDSRCLNRSSIFKQISTVRHKVYTELIRVSLDMYGIRYCLKHLTCVRISTTVMNPFYTLEPFLHSNSKVSSRTCSQLIDKALYMYTHARVFLVRYPMSDVGAACFLPRPVRAQSPSSTVRLSDAWRLLHEASRNLLRVTRKN